MQNYLEESGPTDAEEVIYWLSGWALGHSMDLHLVNNETVDDPTLNAMGTVQGVVMDTLWEQWA